MNSHDVVRRAVRYALFANAAALAAIPAAHAQDAPATPDDSGPVTTVIVTGSRISEPGLTSVSPVTTVTPEEIKQQGATRIEDLLNTLPQVFADQGGGISNGATGEATIDLRGLGVQRTLVLVNGRRLMPGDPAPPSLNGFSAPDLNNIPAALVERIDVLTGGASSTYGADAVAGVVNFVMNDHFEGFRVDANASEYEHHQHSSIMQATVLASGDALPSSTVNDGKTKDITFLLGKNFADGAGNFTAYGSYRRVDALLESQRDFSACTPDLSGASPTGFVCGGSSTSATGRFEPISANGAPAANPGSYTVSPSGGFVPFTAANKYNYAPTNYFQRPDERWTAGEFTHLDITDKMQIYNEFMFMHDNTTAQVAPGGAFIGQGPSKDPVTGIPNGQVTTNCSNPFLDATELTALCNGSTAGNAQFFLGRRDVEGGGRTNEIDHTSFRMVLGLKGEILDGWKYDAYLMEGQTQYANFGGGNFSKTNFADALQVVTGANGTPVCASGNSACVPYNPFAPGGVTAAALKYVDIPTLLIGSTEERVGDANITGELGKYGVKLPWTSDGLIVNIGSQWRSETAVLHSDEPQSNDDVFGAGGPIENLSAGFHVWEGYLEGGMPILQDAPFAKELSVESGYRYSSYNLGFKTNTYKFGVNFAPTSDVRVRASYQRAVRAPNLQELFAQKVLALEGAYDDCAGSSTGSPTASLLQCARTGVTGAQYGKILPSPAGQYQGLVGGNPALKPEKADTTDFGIVFTPSFIPNLSVELDYFNIRVKDVISSYGFPLQLTGCLQSGTPLFCSDIHRDAVGTLWASPLSYIADPTLNLGALQNRGLDITSSYKLDLAAAGKLSFNLAGTYTAQFITEPGGELGVQSYNCAGYFGNTCGVPAPKWKHKVRVNYETPIEGLQVGAQWRYLSRVLEDTNSPNPLLNGSVDGAFGHIASYSYIDLSAAYTLNKTVSFRVGVNNVADKDPPLLSNDYFAEANVNGNTYTQVYDSMGRFLFANITLNF
jgi:iron complex outermembrane receptor protein